MSRLNAANNAQSLLDGAISNADVTMTVLDGSIFPEPPFLVTVEDEIIEVRAKTGNVFGSLLRGQEGTVAVAHADGVEVQNRMTVGMYDSLALQEDVTDLAGTGRTIETVKGNADDLAAHLADTANPHEVTATQAGAVNKTGDIMTGNLNVRGQLQIEYANTDMFATLKGPIHRTLRIDIPGNDVVDGLLVRTSLDGGATYTDRLKVGANGSLSQNGDTVWHAGNQCGSSAWNGAHLTLGNYHFWVDSSGRLRVKSGSPTSDTDGTIVGTQS